jgi:predicted amidohydrolase YtcJ
VLIARAEVEGEICEVRMARGRVAELAPALPRRPREAVLDAAGGALLPGLHDHHLHLFALAAARVSVRCGPPHVRDRDALARALRAARPDATGWVRGVGYHESVAGSLGREALDALLADAPVRVQHRSGALWCVNSAGAGLLGLDLGADAPGVERDARGRATGRLYRLDAWLREQLGLTRPPSLAEVGAELAAFGVTGVTDATPGNGPGSLAALAAALARGELPQRVVAMGAADLPAPTRVAVRAGLSRGARKILLREDALPSLDELVETVRAAHAGRRAVAIHCVTRAELVLAGAALSEAGARPGDRIEHAAVAPPDAARELAALAVTVVTQPGFVHERGDAWAAEVEPRDRPWLWRCRGLLEAGLRVGGGTDAPFGEPDPWRAMRAAVSRRSEAGLVLGADEAVSPERALALFTTPPEDPGGPPRRVVPGAPADLVLLDAPWRAVREDLDARRVRATLRAGRIVWRRDAVPGSI